jgi:hypothetical protein
MHGAVIDPMPSSHASNTNRAHGLPSRLRTIHTTVTLIEYTASGAWIKVEFTTTDALVAVRGFTLYSTAVSGAVASRMREPTPVDLGTAALFHVGTFEVLLAFTSNTVLYQVGASSAPSTSQGLYWVGV